MGRIRDDNRDRSHERALLAPSPTQSPGLPPNAYGAATIALLVATFGFSSITLGGSTPASQHPARHRRCTTHPARYQPGFEPPGNGRRAASFLR